jgi:hypothetical protein
MVKEILRQQLKRTMPCDWPKSDTLDTEMAKQVLLALIVIEC